MGNKSDNNTENRGFLGLMKEVLSIPAGKFGFVLMVVTTVGCILMSTVFKDTSWSFTGSLICGITSVVGCQQFIRVASVIIATRDQEDEK